MLKNSLFKKSVLVLMVFALISCLAPAVAGAAAVPPCVPKLAPDGDGTVINIAFSGDRDTLKNILLAEGWMVDNSIFHHGDGLALQKNVTLDLRWIPLIGQNLVIPIIRDHINLWQVNDPQYGTITYGNAHHDTYNPDPIFGDPVSHWVTAYDSPRDLVAQDFHRRVTQQYGGAAEIYLQHNSAGNYQCVDPLSNFMGIPNPWYHHGIGNPYTNGRLAFCLIGSGD